MSTKYIRNEFGGVHSIDNDVIVDEKGNTAFTSLMNMSPGGQQFLPLGWTELTEAEAKKANPQLFGKADPMVRMNAAERMNAAALGAYEDKE